MAERCSASSLVSSREPPIARPSADSTMACRTPGTRWVRSSSSQLSSDLGSAIGVALLSCPCVQALLGTATALLPALLHGRHAVEDLFRRSGGDITLFLRARLA